MEELKAIGRRELDELCLRAAGLSQMYADETRFDKGGDIAMLVSFVILCSNILALLCESPNVFMRSFFRVPVLTFTV